MKNQVCLRLLSVLLCTETLHAEPKVKISAQLSGLAATEAKAFAKIRGERYPFPATVNSGSTIELGQEFKHPVVKDDCRFVGVMFAIKAKAIEGEIRYNGTFRVTRLGAIKQGVDPTVAPRPFEEWESIFNGFATPEEEVTADLSKEAGSPASITLRFTIVNDGK